MEKIYDYINLILRDYLKFSEIYEVFQHENSLIISSTSKNHEFIDSLNVDVELRGQFEPNIIKAVRTLDKDIISNSIKINYYQDHLTVAYSFKSLKELQDIEFLQSLYADINKDYNKLLQEIFIQRESYRMSINDMIKDKLKEPVKGSLQEERLLRIPPAYRTHADSLAIEKIMKQRFTEVNACYNTNSSGRDIFKFKMFEIEPYFCVDLYQVKHDIESGLISVELILSDGVKIEYPLDKDQSDQVILKLRELDLIRDYLIYPELLNKRRELNQITLKIKEEMS